MTAVVVGVVVVFLIVGSVVGWHGQKVVSAHSDVKVGKARARNGRKTRFKSGLWVLGFGIVLVLMAWDAITHAH